MKARYVAPVIAVLMLLSAVPLFAPPSEGTVPPSVDPDPAKNIILEGYALFDSENTTIVPKIFVMVVKNNPVKNQKEYLNVKEGELISGDVNIDPGLGNMYRFSVEVPLITDPANTWYYFCAYNSVKIQTVSSMFVPEPETLVPAVSPEDGVYPDEESWGTPMPPFEAYKLKADVWSAVPTDRKVLVTGEDTVDPDETVHISADKITLKRAMGTVKGHVDGTIGGTTDSLEDVIVEFRNSEGLAGSTTTDSKGNYTMTLPTGEYKVSFSRGNYKCEPITVNVYENAEVPANATMTIELDTQYFGYDLPHFLMFIAAGACVLIVFISSVYQYKRIKKRGKADREWILDDMPETDEEEGKN